MVFQPFGGRKVVIQSSIPEFSLITQNEKHNGGRISRVTSIASACITASTVMAPLILMEHHSGYGVEHRAGPLVFCHWI